MRIDSDLCYVSCDHLNAKLYNLPEHVIYSHLSQCNEHSFYFCRSRNHDGDAENR